MDNYTILKPLSKDIFDKRLIELETLVREYLQAESLEGRTLQWCKIFLSDAQNQYTQLIESDLYQDIVSTYASTIVEQAPADGSKIAMLIKTSTEPAPYIFQSMRLTEGETRGTSSYLQTMMLFEKYVRWLKEQGLRLDTHCVRTWIYVNDIDNNYAGAVKARNDIFQQHGLTIDTHFIASTGIGGASHIQSAQVAIDFLTYPNIEESNKTYLKALDHLNPTHEYGVAFERGTKLSLADKTIFYISGTASIDRHGHVIYLRDIGRQAKRLLENIGALLKDGNATMEDIKYFIVYLRDTSDYEQIESFMQQNYPHIPHVIVRAKVCRPEWLVEMECLAQQ